MAGFPVPKFDRLPASLLVANNWNPNKMTDFMYRKAVESLTEFGFIAPVVVRPVNGTYEIIDGEHRFHAAIDIGIEMIPCIVVEAPDDVARKLTVVLNELHGQSDPGKLSDLLSGLLSTQTPDQVLNALPFTPDILNGFVGLGDIPFLNEPKQERKKRDESWVERTYRMPASVAEVVDDASNKARARAREEESRDLQDFEVLEILAAEYLAS